jgi:hypothetical protein
MGEITRCRKNNTLAKVIWLLFKEPFHRSTANADGSEHFSHTHFNKNRPFITTKTEDRIQTQLEYSTSLPDLDRGLPNGCRSDPHWYPGAHHMG